MCYPMMQDGIRRRFHLYAGNVRVKIELSPVIRGCVFPPVRMEVREEVEKLFGYAEILVASLPDLYAGKLEIMQGEITQLCL